MSVCQRVVRSEAYDARKSCAERRIMKALARFVSLQSLLIAATIVVGLCQLGYAYFSRSPAAGCITERAVARDAPTHASFGPGAVRRQACSLDADASTRRH